MKTDEHTSYRVFIVFGVLFFLFALLIFQFFRIQILEHAEWEKRAENQHYFFLQEPAKRGIFWSNASIKKGHPERPQKFVIDVQKFHLCIDAMSIPEEKKLEIANIWLSKTNPTQKEAKFFVENFYKKSHYRRIVMWLDEKTKEDILLWWKPYAKKHKIVSNAVFFAGDYQRLHPFGKLLGQVLHTVRAQKDAKEQVTPTGGLELSYNLLLKGVPGKRRLLRTPRHSIETNEVLKNPQDGADIYLTINHCLQAIAEEEIEKGVRRSGAKGGWAIIMDPFTGHVFALAQYPFFYPDSYPLYFSTPGLSEHAKIKAITDANEPGSVMKAITVSIALKANMELAKQGRKPIFHPLEKIDTSKGIFAGRGRKDLKDLSFHHFLNMYLAMQKSSNIYMATLVDRIIKTLGPEWYRKELNETFGFGRKTNIELPSESSGILPRPGKCHPNGKLEWSVPTPYSLAMGHNVQATSLQIARAYCIFANGGYSVQPTVIRKIVRKNSDGTQEVIVDNDILKKRPERVLDEQIVNEVVRAMKFVTKKGGAAHVADILGYTEAGKTGTTMKIVNGVYTDKRHFSSFVGFAPVSKPRFVLFVGIDEPKVGFIPGLGFSQRGSTCVAPIFREIGTRVLEYLGIPPDDPFGYPKGDPRSNLEKSDWHKEVEELFSLYKQWNSKK